MNARNLDGSEASEQMNSLPQPVAALIQAANAHDAEAFLDCFTEEGAVDDWGREFRGAAAIQGWSDAEFIGVAVTLAVTAVEQRSDETVVTAEVGGGGFNGPSHFSFRLAGALVSRMTIRA
jgi:ketosteroid isomerase-like protein